MLYFIDQTSEKDHHMVFNSSIIQILLLMYPTQKLVYYGIESNQKSVLSLLDDSQKKRLELQTIIYTKPINEHFFFKLLNFFRKEKLRLKLFKKMFAKTTPNDLVFLSITTFTSFYAFKKMKRKFEVKTIVTLHGDVDFIYNATNFYEKTNAYLHKRIFKTTAPNFYYLLLNKIAKKQLVADNYLKPTEVFEINHPFNVLNTPNNKDLKGKKPILIGHIGSMEIERKNSHYLYQIASKLSDLIPDNKIKFTTIGLITPGILAYKNNFVSEITGNTRPEKPDYLTRTEYENNVLNLDFAIFFFQKPHYIFRASGAVIDAVAFQIPIIALKHPFFENIFSQSGPIGYLCDNLKEMEQIIRKIANQDKQLELDYLMFKKNLKVLRNRFTTQQIASDLQDQLQQ